MPEYAAMKVLHPHLRTAPLEAALRAEARLTMGLSLPHVVSAIDLLEEDAALVMPFIDGSTLEGLAQTSCEDATTDASARGAYFAALLHVLDGLDACHALGIVHRDVCPSNILVNARGEGHLADFGLAWGPDGWVLDPQGSVQGTFAYLAPEQIEAAPATPLVDVFACGVVAWEIAAGRRLHVHGNTTRTLLEVTDADAPRLHAAPTRLADAIERALRRDPAKRTPSAAAFAGELREALEEADRQPK